MIHRIKQLWLEALRSGEYKPGQGTLVQVAEDGSKRYCCLGVLCELALKDGVKMEVAEVEYNIFQRDLRVMRYNGEASTLPVAVMQWAGVQWANPWVEVGDGKRESLAMLNDGPSDVDGFATAREDFSDVAWAIEATEDL